MNLTQSETTLPGVAVPRSLIANPDRFGGRVVGDCLVGDLVVRAGQVAGLTGRTVAPVRMVLPTLTDPHVHLDKCHTIDRLGPVGGDLAAAIAAQARDRAGWTEDDVRARGSRGLAELSAAGCGAVRSHVDWGNEADRAAVPLAWDVLGEVAEDVPGVTVQRAALVDIATLADEDAAHNISRRLARDAGVLGSFVLDQPERRAGVRAAFRAADRAGLALDFHVDEGLAPGLDGLDIIADVALETGHEGPVLCGHACSLMNRDADAVARIGDKLARAAISVSVLPSTNLYLQGRNGGTPDRRGLSRVHELRAAGVNVVLGADNVRDAFCPLGRHDPRHTLSLAVLAAHLDPPFGDHLPMIATGARQATGMPPITVDGAAPDDLLVAEAATTSDLLDSAAEPLRLSELLEAGAGSGI